MSRELQPFAPEACLFRKQAGRLPSKNSRTRINSTLAPTTVDCAMLKTLNEEKTVHITKPEGAELAKLFTNVYRYVTFALANEFALLAEVNGADAHEIIRASNEGYPRGGIPLPGPCGGPCLAKDG